MLDHDDDDSDREQISANYNEHQRCWFGFTTSSHQQEKNGVIANRWKVVMPLLSPISAERYTMLCNGLALLKSSDKAQARTNQVFYAPNVIAPGAPYDYINGCDWPLLDASDDSDPLVSAALAAYEQAQKKARAKASTAAPKPRNVSSLDVSIIEKAVAAYDLASLIEAKGYTRIGRAWLSPESSTGNPGVHILRSPDGKERLYSHHGATDPLSNINHDGHALDVVDVLVALDYGGDFKRAIAQLADDLDPEGQKQRRQEYAKEKAREEAIEQFGCAVTAEAQKLAEFIHAQLIERLEVDPEEQPEQAESLWPDAENITRMINGSFWSGSKSKVFLLNHDESLVQFKEADSYKFLTRTFGNIVDRAAVASLAAGLTFGCASPEAEENAREKFIGSCMNVAKTAILDHLKYHNQRESLEWRVDMFAKFSRLELIEDKARIVLTHKPFIIPPKPAGYAAIIEDYKAHFPRFDEFLAFVVWSRFALDRKKSYLWLHATSDWGKGFLTGILKRLGVCVETSMKEVEAMLEGKPVGRSAEDFKRAMVLLIDEFKTVKSELKQLQSEITLSPKNQLSCTVEIFAKVFTSAESVGSLVTDNGVEDQFANRMSVFQEHGDITRRQLYASVGNAVYFNAVLAYTAEFLNQGIEHMRRLGRDGAEAEAERKLNGFIKQYGLDTVFERFSDTLPQLAEDIVHNIARYNFVNVIEEGGYVFLSSPAKVIDDYLVQHFDHSQIAAFRKKKDEIMRLMSEDGRGSASHNIKGKSRKCIKLKTLRP